MAKLQVSLTPVRGTSADKFVFPLCPERAPRQYDATYVPSPIAQADWMSSKGVPPAIWARNNPERISLEALLVDERQLTGSGSDDIEEEIQQLEAFRRRDQSGSPPDLVLTWGAQTDTVRIESMSIEPRLWTEDGARKQATLSLRLIVMRPRRS